MQILIKAFIFNILLYYFYFNILTILIILKNRFFKLQINLIIIISF